MKGLVAKPRLARECTAKEQMALWVQGESVHRLSEDGGTCVPDFSCCEPSFASPLDERRAFAAGSPLVRDRLLASYLQRAIDLYAERQGREAPRVVVVSDALEPRGKPS